MTWLRWVSAATLFPALLGGKALAAEPPSAKIVAAEPLADADFARLHALVKPGVGESRWMEIDWHPSIHEARQIAAAQGKPLFLWAGSGGAPPAGC